MLRNGLDDTKPDVEVVGTFWFAKSYVEPKASLLRVLAFIFALINEWLVAAGPFSEKYPLAVCNESGLVGVGGSSNGVCSMSSDGLYGVTICRGTWLYCGWRETWLEMKVE